MTIHVLLFIAGSISGFVFAVLLALCIESGGSK